MFSHMVVGTNDIAASRAFYDAVLGTLGIVFAFQDPKSGRCFWRGPGGLFGVTLPIDGEAATAGNGSTVGFACASPAQVDAWHAAGVAHGGTSIEDPPGVRGEGTPMRLYLAYLRDPAGNKLCAMHALASD